MSKVFKKFMDKWFHGNEALIKETSYMKFERLLDGFNVDQLLVTTVDIFDVQKVMLFDDHNYTVTCYYVIMGIVRLEKDSSVVNGEKADILRKLAEHGYCSLPDKAEIKNYLNSIEL